MSINIEDVDHVANLARLSFNKEEQKEFVKKFNDILEYVEKLKEVNVEGIEATYHIFPTKNPWREDQIKPSLAREKVLMNTSDKQQGCFKVPKVVE
ncbi:Asp-tRNA(Asn)/Glu-tRNA(Gln) amidotransferase subunit GatC [Clostridiaceae bacterium 35-E11]